MDLESKFRLWQFDTVKAYNDNTELVFNKNSHILMIKKIMPADEAELHRSLSDIRHRNIVGIYDVVSDGNKCIVLEQYISGKTLESCETMSEKAAVDIMVQLCTALEFIHNMGIIHRDITPSNVMLSDDGIVKLIDFDIARKFKDSAPNDTRILGTEGFAAPEQFGFEQTTARTDIYSLGVLLNYLLTGDKDIKNIYENNPRLKYVIEKCTELEPQKRYESAARLRAVLIIALYGKKYFYKTDYASDGFDAGITFGKRDMKFKRIYISVITFITTVISVFFSIGVYMNTSSPEDFLLRTLVIVLVLVIPILLIVNPDSFQKRLFKKIYYPLRRVIFIVAAIFIMLAGAYVGIYFNI